MPGPIADLPHAVLHEVAVNELGFDQKYNADGTPTLNDPIKFRFGAFIPLGANKFYIGCIGFDVLRIKDGKVHRTEVGFLKFAVDEVVDGDKDPVPMVELFLTRNSEDSTDAAEDRVFTVSRKGMTVHVPLVANTVPAPPSPQASRVTRFFSDDGAFCFNVQGDDGGKLVQYRIVDPSDESTWVPVAQWKGQAL